jgi:ubiquinone/menaquinone biosynthesis C-methylase UbiE
MSDSNLKKHFNEVAGGGGHSSYEQRRWEAHKRLAEQYRATKVFIEKNVLPLAARARRITELGPGPGTWTQLLASVAPEAEFTLLDISGEMLERAKSALPNHSNTTTKEGDFTSLFLTENSADFFFSSRAIEYVEPKKDAIAAIARLLSKGSSGCIITKTPKRLINKVFGRASARIHQNQISPRKLKKLLVAEGFSEIHISPVTISLPLFHSGLGDRILGAFLRTFPFNPLTSVFSESYAVVFKKS